MHIHRHTHTHTHAHIHTHPHPHTHTQVHSDQADWPTSQVSRSQQRPVAHWAWECSRQAVALQHRFAQSCTNQTIHCSEGQAYSVWTTGNRRTRPTLQVWKFLNYTELQIQTNSFFMIKVSSFWTTQDWPRSTDPLPLHSREFSVSELLRTDQDPKSHSLFTA